VVLRLGMWRTIGKRLTLARAIPVDRSPSVYNKLNSDRARTNPSAKIFIPLSYPLARGTNRNGWGESGREITGGERR
jgi:hypothetical protein